MAEEGQLLPLQLQGVRAHRREGEAPRFPAMAANYTARRVLADKGLSSAPSTALA